MFDQAARGWLCWGLAGVLFALGGCEGTIELGGSAGATSSSTSSSSSMSSSSSGGSGGATGGTGGATTGTGGDGGVPCTLPSDCGAPGDCFDNTCDNHVCGKAPKPNGATCDDGNACTQADTCQSGACVGAAPVTCAAPDACHDPGTCNPATGTCSSPAKADGSLCNDGDACTQADTCQSGACVGASPVTCAASDACHDAGICNPATGTCSNPNKADGSLCNDGNACTQIDTCQSGACVGAAPVTCAALDACHDAGTCNPATGMCSKPNKANGSPCNDGNACTQMDACQSGACVGANPVSCTASDACHDAGACNPATGTCSNPAKANGSPCNDGNACTQADACQSGACVGANPVSCTALDACHNAGTCNPSTGLCSNPNKADNTVCSDGNSCTQTDTCQSGACVGANPVSCAALDQCHVAGVCSPATGCSNPPKPNGAACDDTNVCTQVDTCQSGACVGGSPVVCAGSQICVGGACVASLAPSNLDATTCQSPGATNLTVAVGAVTTLSTDSGCDQVKTQVGAPDICVRKFGQVAIHGTLKASGARVLALVATGDMTIDGVVDVAAKWEISGPGAAAIYGGGYGTASGSGAPAFGNPQLVPISGGSPGDGTPAGGFCKNSAGGGGGGLELVSCGNVTISGTISAGGGGGQCSLGTGRNGGSGGGVLIEGLSVTVSGGVFANGGGGGGGETHSNVEVVMFPGEAGSDATLSLSPAAGAPPTFNDCDGSGAPGGNGGSAMSPPGAAPSAPATCSSCAGGCGFGPCFVGCCSCSAGGGGGAVGRIRLNTVSGPPTLTGSTFSPAPTTGSAVVN